MEGGRRSGDKTDVVVASGERCCRRLGLPAEQARGEVREEKKGREEEREREERRGEGAAPRRRMGATPTTFFSCRPPPDGDLDRDANEERVVGFDPIHAGSATTDGATRPACEPSTCHDGTMKRQW